jgi:hypothetical protein
MSYKAVDDNLPRCDTVIAKALSQPKSVLNICLRKEVNLARQGSLDHPFLSSYIVPLCSYSMSRFIAQLFSTAPTVEEHLADQDLKGIHCNWRQFRIYFELFRILYCKGAHVRMNGRL